MEYINNNALKNHFKSVSLIKDNMNILQKYDPQIASLISQEHDRQEHEIDLIASENYTHPAVLEATASILTNKYAEGYPGKRYYGGCKFVDQVELIAQQRCKELFKADDYHANVQPHSGASANLAVYYATVKPNDVVMGMSLAVGGHLTHGHSANFSGTIYKSVQYMVDPKTQELDYNEIEKITLENKPKLIIAGASAYSRIIDFEKFGKIAKSVGAYLLADISHIAGLVAVGLHPSPVGHADFISSTTHKTLRGTRGAFILCKNPFKDAVDRAVFPMLQGGPLMHIIAAKAVGFKLALEKEFKDYQESVVENAKSMALTFQQLGYDIVAGGTDNHLFIVDLRSKKITGRQAELLLESAGITVSRSCIPYDPEKPWITSGIRIGTPAIATRGMKLDVAKKIVLLIDELINNRDDTKIISDIKLQVAEICKKYPIYK